MSSETNDEVEQDVPSASSDSNLLPLGKRILIYIITLAVVLVVALVAVKPILSRNSKGVTSVIYDSKDGEYYNDFVRKQSEAVQSQE